MNERTTFIVRPETHRAVKLLAVQEGRKVHKDLVDDLIMLGVEAFEQAKNFAKNVNRTVYTKGE